MLGFGARIGAAFRCFFSLLFTGRLPDDLLDQMRPAAEPATAADDRSNDRAIQLLAILQRDGRLVDFLRESLDGYADAQVGAAVRDVHATCRSALDRYVTVEPLLTEIEGDRIPVGATVDPSRLKVLGIVPAEGAAGIVRHRGWRVTRVALPPLPNGGAREIVAPAEVEVG